MPIHLRKQSTIAFGLTNTCTQHAGLPSSSYDHGSSCKGVASSFRPKTAWHRRDAV